MRRTKLIGVLAALVLVGAILIAPAAEATDSQSTDELPFRATSEGSATGMEFAPGFPLERSTFGGRCSVPSDWVISFEGSGQATYLGAFTWTSSHCTQVDFVNLQNITYSDGHLEYVAANGDLLFEDYGNGVVSVLTPTMLCFEEDETFTGGTGRFVNASGSALGHGCQPTAGPTAPFVLTATGTISFDASDRTG